MGKYGNTRRLDVVVNMRLGPHFTRFVGGQSVAFEVDEIKETGGRHEGCHTSRGTRYTNQ